MEYTNPILYADYSDPDPIRVGDDFYMVASSFTYFPGVPILHSQDLVHWQILNHAVKSLPFDKYAKPCHGSGTWAPSIRYHEGEFFIFIPLVDEGIMVARSKDIRGEFALNMLIETKGWIDPCPIWCEDGKAYMVFAFAFSRSGQKNKLAIIEIDPECTHTISDPKIIFDGTGFAPTSEGPKIYFHEGYYYVLFPSGGVATGWQSCIRARNIEGPYEYRIVMHQGKSNVNGPHQGGWVTAPDGSDWFIHFQDVIELGRIIHLEPLHFTEDLWPVIGCGEVTGEPVKHFRLPVEGKEHYKIATSDDFTSPSLGLQWQWQANPRPGFFSLSEREGFLRLFCSSNPERRAYAWYAPNLLTQIPQSPTIRVTAALELEGRVKGDFAAIGMLGHSYAMLGVEYDGTSYSLKLIRGSVFREVLEGEALEEEVLALPLGSGKLLLRFLISSDKEYTFSYSEDGSTFIDLDEVFELARCTWTGAKIFIWSTNRENLPSEGYADFDHVHID